MTFKNQIPRNIVQSSERETVRLLQDLIARVQKIETNGTIPLDAVSPRPATAGDAVDKITLENVDEIGVTSVQFYGDGVTTVFSLPSTWVDITNPDELSVVIDGAYQSSDQFAVGSGTLTFVSPPPYAPSYQPANIFVKWTPDTGPIAVLVNLEKATINAMIDSLRQGGALK